MNEETYSVCMLSLEGVRQSQIHFGAYPLTSKKVLSPSNKVKEDLKCLDLRNCPSVRGALKVNEGTEEARADD
jgi:hypothetical protein